MHWAIVVGLCFHSLVPSSLAGVTTQHFFVGSVRRDADTLEKDTVVRVGSSGCTAYFVENTSGKTIVGSARHCMNMSATNWCKKGFFTDNEGKKGKCVGIIAADLKHDVAFLEADFGYAPRSALRLSSVDPALNTELKMIGYPCDKFRSCGLTVTEKCRILKTGVASPHGTSMSDKSALHDCTTYGGNSGGPMIASGTSTVVGLPFTYLPGNYAGYPSNTPAHAAAVALMSDFVALHRKELEAAGVALAD